MRLSVARKRQLISRGKIRANYVAELRNLSARLAFMRKPFSDQFDESNPVKKQKQNQHQRNIANSGAFGRLDAKNAAKNA